ncbi:hypothetical protein [Cellulosilyticum ruminicola]|uniref:hypothetical protein n=1 Tax=Cellulosilyticum ruminicola TaxID=425254 RepID=UPI0006D0377A|nr:hypothetical protein [Cellulosilyticum ruminicola]
MKITEIKHAEHSNMFGGIIELAYSERASEMLGRRDRAKLIYESIHKDGKQKIQLKEFKIIEKDI